MKIKIKNKIAYLKKSTKYKKKHQYKFIINNDFTLSSFSPHFKKHNRPPKSLPDYDNKRRALSRRTIFVRNTLYDTLARRAR